MYKGKMGRGNEHGMGEGVSDRRNESKDKGKVDVESELHYGEI